MQSLTDNRPTSIPKSRPLGASDRARRFIRHCQLEILARLFELRRNRARKGQR